MTLVKLMIIAIYRYKVKEEIICAGLLLVYEFVILEVAKWAGWVTCKIGFGSVIFCTGHIRLSWKSGTLFVQQLIIFFIDNCVSNMNRKIV